MLYLGDCLEVMRTLAADSVDSVVTDPPAGISFMGKEWDNFGGRTNKQAAEDRAAAYDRYGKGALPYGFSGSSMPTKKERQAFIAFLTDIMTEALRVLKPGGHALVWALPRTSHWTATALEDAGFEIRDSIHHLMGSGFPKSRNVGKTGMPALDALHELRQAMGIVPAAGTETMHAHAGEGTALKPAHEVWWLCRKPLTAATVAGNVLEYGTGALNIDATRVGYEQHDLERLQDWSSKYHGKEYQSGTIASPSTTAAANCVPPNTAGRWPSNLVLSHIGGPDGCVPLGERRVKGASGWSQSGSKASENRAMSGANTARNPKPDGFTDPDGYEVITAWDCHPSCPVRILGEQSGELKSGNRHPGVNTGTVSYKLSSQVRTGTFNGDTGTASRFFPNFPPDPQESVFPQFTPDVDAPFRYVAKASRRERNQGCKGLPESAELIGAAGHKINPMTGRPVVDVPRANTHPTVKSQALMRWLCRLITPPHGTVLDCFMGSGSTGVAAIAEGFNFIGIEREPEYMSIATARIAAHLPSEAPAHVPHAQEAPHAR